MDSKISVLDINIDNCSAKEAMKRTVEYMGTSPYQADPILRQSRTLTSPPVSVPLI